MSAATPAVPLSSDDAGHLRLLAIFHYVVAALMGLFALVPVIHLVVGLALATGHFGDAGSPMEARLMGWLFAAIALAFILGGLAMAGLTAYAGRCLQRRRRHTLCLVAAAVMCLFVPFGTVLSVFSIVVLSRPAVRAGFA
ncbi:hypothetical protein SD81_028660 [Tolypothrix campylonemoides VB511288]|nr:hypothetical protein SD81_028660 [Tolypothrix campylonemoides VB511288]